MEFTLTPIEIRVLGSLIEKELSTPEYYPLTLNALLNACNQKSNREPVMTLGEEVVRKALDNLRFEQLAHKSAEGVRATKYCHNLKGNLRLDSKEMAVLAVLLLRGPQTQGELRNRTERMHAFKDLEEVETTLQALIKRDKPLVSKLPRQPGRKEHRYAHLLSGAVLQEEGQLQAGDFFAEEGITKQDRLAQLEDEIQVLRAELNQLRQTFEKFKNQFE